MTSFPRRPQPLAVFVIILVVVSLACSLKLPQRLTPLVPAITASSAPAGTPTAIPTATPPPLPQPPALLESDPLPGAEIPLAAPILLRFNQPMERASVEAALHNSAGLVGNFAWANDATVSFQPAAALPPATSLTLTVDAQAQSKKGMKMLSPVDLHFQTAGYLELAQTLPANGALEVDPASAVVAAFNRPVVPLGADPASLPDAFTLEPALSGRGEWVNTSTYIFYPDLGLGGGVTYVARLNPNLQSTDGGPLDQAQTEWTFSVALPYPQTFAPIDTAMDVPLDTAAQIVFNQSMDTPSTQANFKLLDEQLQPVAGQFGWDEKFTTLYFTPTQLLARNATYTVQLLPGAASAAGLPLNISYQASWITVPSFFVTNTDPQPGGTKRNFNNVTVWFSSFLPMEGDLEPFISVTPAITNLYVNADYTSKQIYINGDFKPETEYTLRLDASLRDRWGAPLGQPYEFNFYSGPLDPEVYIPASTDVIFLTPADGALPAQAANLSQIPLNVGSLPLDDFIRMIGPEGYSVRQDYVPADSNSWTVDANAPGSQYVPVSLPLAPDGSALTSGLYFMRLSLPNIYAGPYLLVVSNIQVTYKVSATEAFVWAVDLRTDTPVGSLPVTIYLDDGQVLANGETNAEGVFRAPIPTRQDPGQTTLAVVGAPGTDNFGLALSNWDQMVSPYNFGISLDDRAPHTQTYIYTDRPIYRPGQTVYFRMIARRIENGRYFPADQSQLQVKVFDNTGTEVNAFDLPLSGLGTASGEFVLDKNAQPGYYRLETGDDNLQFIVAEYRKPEINLSVTLSPDALRYGETLQGLVDAQYFFGAPASEVKADWSLYARSDAFSLPGFNVGVENQNWLEAFYFPEGMFGGLGSQIASGSAVTGPDGKLALDLPTTIENDWLADTSPLVYTLEVTLTDESGQPVSARAEARVHREDYYIGLRPDAWVAQSGQETGYAVQVMDWNAGPAGERSLHAEYRKVTWSYQRADNRFSPPEPVAEYTPVASVDFATSPEGTARLAFTPTEPGTFELRITGGAATTTLTQWVGGPGQPVWPNLPNQRLRLTADREAYVPGNTAQVFIPNPFGQPALALVTLERANVMQSQVVTLPADGNTLPFLLTDEHAPNVYLSVLLLGRTPGGAPDFHAGYINLDVAPVELVLNVNLTVQPDRAGPGDEVTVNVRVTDSASLPVQGEFSLAVVDLAVLKLADPFARDIDQAFYGRQPLGVRMGLSLAVYGRRDVWMPGGMGGGGGDAVGTVREEFPDTAYWNPSITTDANGEAALTLKLPDSLTTWQLDLRGITADNRVGQASARLITSKDLLVRPVTPRFVVVGDRVQLAAIVQNTTASDLLVEAALQSDGLVLEGAAFQNITVPANGRVRVEWWGTVQDVESLDLVFSARGGGLEDASRAADGALPVLRYRAPQAFATAGVLDSAGEQLELVSLPPNTDLSASARAGGLHLQLSPSLGAAAYDALQALNNETYASTEQVLSRLLGNLSTLQAARNANLGNAALETDLQQAVLQALSLLVSRQDMDGGWGWWADGTSDVHITAYALVALVQARQAGVSINEYSLARFGLPDYQPGRARPGAGRLAVGPAGLCGLCAHAGGQRRPEPRPGSVCRALPPEPLGACLLGADFGQPLAGQPGSSHAVLGFAGRRAAFGLRRQLGRPQRRLPQYGLCRLDYGHRGLRPGAA